MNQQEVVTTKPFLKFHSISNPKEWMAHIRRNYCRRNFSHLADGNTPVFTEDSPTIKMIGTTKVHGTHGDVVVYPDGTVQAQSKNRIVDVFNDNQGWADFVFRVIGEEFWQERAGELNAENTIVVFAFEWAGQGIQSVVGVSQLERFALSLGTILVDNADKIEQFHGQVDEDDNICALNMTKRLLASDMWLSYPDQRIFSVADSGEFEFDFDFDSTKGNIDDMFTLKLPELLDKVENDCPVAKMVAKHDGVELVGENIGEGIVFVAQGPEYGTRSWFKYKGTKHEQAGQKVRHTPTPVTPEIQAAVNQFVSDVCTESRLRQGIDYLTEMGKTIDIKVLTDFMKWVFEDIKKEETQRLLEAGLNFKQVSKSISNVVRGWFFEYHN